DPCPRAILPPPGAPPPNVGGGPVSADRASAPPRRWTRLAASLDPPCRCAAGPASPRPALVLTATEHVSLAQRRHGTSLHRKGHEHGKARLADHRRGSAHRSRI